MALKRVFGTCDAIDGAGRCFDRLAAHLTEDTLTTGRSRPIGRIVNEIVAHGVVGGEFRSRAASNALQNQQARISRSGRRIVWATTLSRGVDVAENKTQITDVDPISFIASVENPTRRADAESLLDLMTRATGCKPKMWGPSIVGFGRYRYRYDSGRGGEFMLAGFSPRKANLVIYTMPGYEEMNEQLAELGKHRVGKSCLYINKLADVNIDVLEQIVADGVATMRENHETWDE